jgi:hypothetical protein
MKTKTFLLLALLFGVTTCLLNAQNIQGTWKSLGSSGNPLPEGYSTYKFITPSHFIWTMIDKEGNIVSGAGGTYTMIDGVYTETILYTLPGMKTWKGKKAIYNKVEIIGKKLSISGHLEFDKDKKVQNTEFWEKAD